MMYLRIYMFSIYTYSLLDLAQQPNNLTATPSHLIKGIYSCKVLVSFFFQTLSSLTPLPYTNHNIQCHLRN